MVEQVIPLEALTGKPGEIVQISDQPAIVIEADELFTASFARAGDDLLLRAEDGHEILLQGYFAAAQAPQLETPDGARLSPETVEALAGPEHPQLYAQADGIQPAQPIGEVSVLNGIARVQHADGTRGDLSAGDPIFQGDVVSTGVGSELGIHFVDGTAFSLSANARMVIDDLIYNPQSTANSMGVSLIQGTFVFVTGQIAPTGSMEIETPTGTIGIRGTTVGVQIATLGGSTRIVNLINPETGEYGSFIFTNLGGIAEFTQANHFLELRSIYDSPGLPASAPGGFVDRVFGRDLNSIIRIQQQEPPDPQADPDNQQGSLPQEVIESLLDLVPFETAAGGDAVLSGGSVFTEAPWLGQDFLFRSFPPQGVIGEVSLPEFDFPNSFFSVIVSPPSPGLVSPQALFGLPGAPGGSGAGIVAAIKEDSADNLAIFAAQAGGPQNELTSIVISLPGFAPEDVDISQIVADLAGPPALGTVTMTAAAGVTTILITFNDALNVQVFGSSFTLDAPVLGSDVDLPDISITANAQQIADPSSTGTASAAGTLVLDAVLDQAGSVAPPVLPALSESSADQALPLNFSLAFVDTGFDPSGADGDGSEQIIAVAVSLAAGSLALGAGAPAGAFVSDDGGGSFSLHVASPADWGAAIAALTWIVPGGVDGTLEGKVAITTAEAMPNDEEPDDADNSLTIETDFSVTVTGGTVSPTISFGAAQGDAPGDGGPGEEGPFIEGSALAFAAALPAALAAENAPVQILTIKEDSQSNLVPFSIGAGDATDEITAVVFELPGVAPGDIDIAQVIADLEGPPVLGTATLTTPGGVTTITITFDETLDVQGFASAFTLSTPLADSDLDLTAIKVTAFAKDISNDDATGSASIEGAVVVDAVADPVTVALEVTSAGGTGDFAPGQSGNVHLLASFGDADDGSELHSVVVDIPEGFTVGSLDGLPAGVAATVDENGDVVFTLAAGVAGLDFTFEVIAPTPLTEGGGYTFTAIARAEEQPLDLENDFADNVAEQSAQESATVTLPTVALQALAGFAGAPALNGGAPLGSEVQEGGGAWFRLAVGQPTFAPISVTLEANDGSATAPADFDGLSFDFFLADGTSLGSDSSVDIPVGETEVFVRVATLADDLFEGLEDFNLEIAAATNAVFAPGAEAAGAIADDVIVSVGDGGDAFEDPSLPGSDSLTFTVSLSEVNASGAPVVVTYTLGGTATPGLDYDTSGLIPAEGIQGIYQVAIGAGAQSAEIVLPVLDDGDIEADAESVTVTLTGSSTAAVTLGDASGSASITDLNGTISVSDAGTVPEGGTLNFEISLALTSGALAEGTVVRVPLSYGGEATVGDFAAPPPAFIDLVVDGSGLAAAATLSLATVSGDGFEGLEGVTVTAGGPIVVDADASAVIAEGIAGADGFGAIELTEPLTGKIVINEIGLGVGTSVAKAGNETSPVNEDQNYFEIRNVIDHAISSAEIRSLSIQIIGADGGEVTIDLSTASGGSIDIPPRGFLTIFEDGTWATSTSGGEVQQTGTYSVPGSYTGPGSVWGFGSDSSTRLGVNLRQDGESVDMFVANGAAFAGAGDAWIGSGSGTPTVAALLGALVDLDSFSGAIGDQNALLAALGRSDIVIGDSSAPGDEVTRVFSRVFADAPSGGEDPGDAFATDRNQARDWTTSNAPTFFASPLNDDDHPAPGVDDVNPQDPSDDLNPAQGAGTNDAEAGQTVLDAQSAGDTLEGGRGQDFLFGDADANRLAGGDHNDFLFGDRGDDRLEGQKGADLLVDVDGQDILIGGSGDDVLIGGAQHLGNAPDPLDASGDLLIGDDVVASAVPRFNVVFVLDISGSMNRALDGSANPPAGQSRLDYAKLAFLTLNQQIIDAGLAGVVSVKVVPFNHRASEQNSPDFGRADDPALKNFIAALETSGNTQFEAPLQIAANWLLEDDRHLAAQNLIVFLSDGVDNDGYSPSSTLRADLYGLNGGSPNISNLRIEAFGIGTESASTFSRDELGEVETGQSGNGDQVTVVDDVANIEQIFSAISLSDETFGEDVILAGSGNDYIFGDTLVIDPGFEGSERAYVEEVLFAGGAEAEGLRQAIGTLGDADWIDGGAGDDRILGQGGDDYVTGGAGHDLIDGGSGSDTLLGGLDEDILWDGSGADLIYGGGGADIIVLTPDNQTDTLFISTFGDIGDSVFGFDTHAPALGGDFLDLSALLSEGDFSGTSLAQAVSQGYVTLSSDNNSAAILVDLDGASGLLHNPALAAMLVATDLAADPAALSDNILVD